MSLRMGAEEMAAIREHGERDYPLECCGLLLGRRGEEDGVRRVEAVRAMRNAHPDSPQNRYELDPAEHVRAQREARERGWEIVGYYHTHPDHPAQPSRTDLELASWPGYSYMIVSVRQGKSAEANSFELAEDRSRFVPEAVEVSSLY